VYENSKLQIKSIINKARTLMLIRDMGYKSVVAVGDGANDEGMLNLADVGIAYGAIHPSEQTAIHASKYIVHDAGTLCNLLRML
jgi:P-type E1-E2 ATPase